jgi:hypothetical protein
MGQVLHGSATTTYKAVRRAIQHSQASLRALAKRYGINQKTVAKWKGRTSVSTRSSARHPAATQDSFRLAACSFSRSLGRAKVGRRDHLFDLDHRQPPATHSLCRCEKTRPPTRCGESDECPREARRRRSRLVSLACEMLRIRPPASSGRPAKCCRSPFRPIWRSCPS